MKDLEYKIGDVKMDGSSTRDFVVEAVDERTVTIYIGPGPGHKNVAKNFGLNPGAYSGYDSLSSWSAKKDCFVEDTGGRVVGGGRFVFSDDNLKLEYHSGAYGPIPKYVAEMFVNLLSSTLKDKGFQINNTVANPTEYDLYNPFWRDE